jgi:hypothetical protein
MLCKKIRFGRCNKDGSLNEVHPDHADEYGADCPFKWENFDKCQDVELVVIPTRKLKKENPIICPKCGWKIG